MTAQVVYLKTFRVRFWIDLANETRRVYEEVVPALTATSAVLRATREHSKALFGPNRSGRVISVIEQ